MNAREGEKILYQARLHWIIYTWPTLLLVAGCYILAAYEVLAPLAYLLLAGGVALGLGSYINYRFSFLNITTTCLVINTGILVKQRTNIPWRRVESIDVTQSIIGSLFGYGSIMFIGTGSTRNFLKNIAEPQVCRRYIEQVLEN